MVVYKCKLADYSKAADYKCKAAVYSKVAVYKCKLVDYSKAVVYECKGQITVKQQFPSINQQFTLVKYFQVYNCSHNFAGHCGGNTFLSNLFLKQWFTDVNRCFTINHHFTSCKLPLYCKPLLYKL